jgi:hypothetical protein
LDIDKFSKSIELEMKRFRIFVMKKTALNVGLEMPSDEECEAALKIDSLNLCIQIIEENRRSKSLLKSLQSMFLPRIGIGRRVKK